MREGEVNLLAGDVFYSSFQLPHRDATVLILKELLLQSLESSSHKSALRYLDLFCGNGIRSLRFVKEVGLHFPRGVEAVGIDAQKECIEVANASAEANNLHNNIRFCQHKIHSSESSLLSNEVPDMGTFDVIDVDPFGNSIQYIPQCLQVMRAGGLLLLTCTDSHDLYIGFGNKKCMTFQTSGILRPPSAMASHEFGLRAAITAACLAIYREGWMPHVEACWAFRHGCRLILRVEPLSPVNNREDMCLMPPMPLATVYVDRAGTMALFGSVGESFVDSGDKGLELDFDNVAADTWKHDEWRVVGPLWSSGTLNVDLIRTIVLKSKAAAAAAPETSVGNRTISRHLSAAVTLLTRLLEENLPFENPFSLHTIHIGGEQQFTYTWGVHTCGHPFHKRKKGVGNVRKALMLNYLNETSLTAAPIFEDHQFFKVNPYFFGI